MAYCYADYLDEPVDGKPYGQLNLMQKTVNKFYNVSVNQNAYYDGNIVEGPDLTVFAEVYNSGSLPVTQFNVKIYDENDSLLQESTIDSNLAVGESAELEIPFRAPTPLRADYRIEILPADGDDILSTDNETNISVGFVDLSIEDVQELRTETGRQLKVKIKNQSFNAISSATVKLLEESADGNVFASEEITSLGAFAEAEFTFDIDESYLDASVSENPRRFYLVTETPDTEEDYSNNDQEIYVYPDYTVTLNAGTGGTVTGAGTYETDSTVTITATPKKGYVFDGWYEDGQLIYGATAKYVITVDSNRTLEARFKTNDLAITDLEVFGTLEVGETLTFTASTEGGQPQYEWKFYIYGNGTMYYVNSNSEIDTDFVTYTPSASGTYTVTAYVTDETGFRVKSTKQFTVA